MAYLMDFSRIEKAQREGNKEEEERLKELALQTIIHNSYRKVRDGSNTFHEMVVFTLYDLEIMKINGRSEFSISIRRELINRFVEHFGMQILNDISQVKRGDAVLVVDTKMLNTYKKAKKRDKLVVNHFVGYFDSIRERDNLVILNKRIWREGDGGYWLFPEQHYPFAQFTFVAGCTPSPMSKKKTFFF